jgi:hypothetical protein
MKDPAYKVRRFTLFVMPKLGNQVNRPLLLRSDEASS